MTNTTTVAPTGADDPNHLPDQTLDLLTTPTGTWWSPMIATTKSSKRQTNLDRLLAQGTLIETDVDGRRAVFLKMPTPELQSELNEELEKKIKQRLKAGGFERVCATRREHPFHSELLRERIDDLADLLSGDHREFSTDARAEATRQDLYGLIENTKNSLVPFTERDIDELVETGRKEARRAWAAAVGECRAFLRDPKWWQGTYLDRALNPPEGPLLPDRPLPKPVYVSKRNPDLVIQLRDNFVDLYSRGGLVAQKWATTAFQIRNSSSSTK